MIGVFFRKDGFGGVEVPVDSERVIENGNAAIGFGVIIFVTLVLKHGDVAEYGEAVGKSFRYKELAMVILGQFNGNVFPVGWRPLTDVDGNIENRALDAANELCLRVRRPLEMQSTHYSPGRAAFVVLYEIYMSDLFVELALGVAFEKIATSIFEDPWLNDYHAFNVSLDYFHDY